MPPRIIDVRRAEDTRDVVHRAVQALAEGQLVGLPTETVYGIGASACHVAAVEKLAATKGRRPDAPFALAVKSLEEALDYVPDMGPLAQRLARRCWPGPVTLVLDAPEEGLLAHLPQPVRSYVCPQGTIGLRVPASRILQDVLRMLCGPIALTSANRSGEKEAVDAQQVVEAVGEHVGMVLDDGPARYGQASTVVRVGKTGYQVLREGVVRESTLERMARYTVVMVCTGNTCRSPMGEAMLRKRLAEQLHCSESEIEQHGITVLSAGLSAAAGAPAAPEAVDLMKERGLDLSRHEARLLTDQVVQHADMLLVLTRGHRQAIVNHWPDAASRTHLLMPNGRDVADPIGGTIDVYRLCAQQIDQAIAERAAEILAAVKQQR